MYFEKLQKQIKTVSEINHEIQSLLENQLRFVRVVGEISNLRCPLSGHLYFALKDQDSQIRAVLFKNQRQFLLQELKDGQQVICDGRITVYKPRGDYQLIIDSVDFHGSGQLQLAFELLKKKLRDEGLFAQEEKKKLPDFVERIILITSPSGAAVHDFLTVCRRRRAPVEIQILPVRVQGQGAAQEIVRALESADRLAPDVIVLCRGGGSIEDLWAFNEEIVARAIHQTSVPVVTGVGHETDFTIADFCSDIRGATPTAAAELLVADARLTAKRISDYLKRMVRELSWRLDSTSSRVHRVNRLLSSFDTAFHQQTLRLDAAFTRLARNISLLLEKKIQKQSELNFRLSSQSPVDRLRLHQSRINHLNEKLQQSVRHHLEKKTTALMKNAAVLDSVSPLATLARGYSIVSKKAPDGQGDLIVVDSRQVSEQEMISVRLSRGSLDCTVTSRTP